MLSIPDTLTKAITARLRTHVTSSGVRVRIHVPRLAFALQRDFLAGHASATNNNAESKV